MIELVPSFEFAVFAEFSIWIMMNVWEVLE